jgi:hypothetical protein
MIQTIFEINSHKKNDAFHVMKTKRRYHEDVIQRNATLHKIQGEQQVASEQRASHTFEAIDDDDIKVRLGIQTWGFVPKLTYLKFLSIPFFALEHFIITSTLFYISSYFFSYFYIV